MSNWGRLPANAGDVNGDGFGDVVLSDSQNFYVYHGGVSGISSVPSSTMRIPEPSVFGLRSLVFAGGDLDGDGYGDLVSTGLLPIPGAFVFWGSAAGLPASPTAVVPSLPLTRYDVFSGSALGDFDGDGFGEIGFSLVSTETSLPIGMVVLGGNAGRDLRTVRQFILPPSSPYNSLPGPWAGPGDFNGDGYVDAAVGADGSSDRNGQVLIYAGSSAGLTTSPSSLIRSLDSLTAGAIPDGFGLNFSVWSAGDVDADGYGDLIIGNSNYSIGRNSLYLSRGGSGWPSATPDLALRGAGGIGRAGTWAAGFGDLNGDGLSDVVTVGGVEGVLVFPGIRSAPGLGVPSPLTPNPASFVAECYRRSTRELPSVISASRASL